MTIKKFILITMLTMVICIMSLGYAALQEKIDITGGASVDSVYRVEITKVEQTALSGTATEKDIPTYTGLTANFNVGLTNTTDSITYNITVSNLGTVDVKLNNTTITTEGSEKISVIKTGINNGDIILAGESKILTVKLKYNGETEENEITSTIKVTLDYTRLKGGTGEVAEEISLAYLVGDTVTFAGSNWYVIEDSFSDQDYVTVLKENSLTNEELGQYAANYTRTCTATDVSKGTSGCTFEGEQVVEKKAAISFYWSDTCHYAAYYGYSGMNNSGCSNHNDYEGSKIREYLEGTYINTIGSENLKQINGYQIRLLSIEDLENNLGWTGASEKQAATEAVPPWVYYYKKSNSWTMTTDTEHASKAWYLTHAGTISTHYVSMPYEIRPVINLLKTSIQ